MRHFAVLLALFAGCVSCSAVTTMPATSPAASQIEGLRESTVALVFEFDPIRGPSLGCSGVWVSADRILTAAHCAMPELKGFGTYEEIGAKADHWKPLPPFHAMVLVAKDEVRDLAIYAVQNPPAHPIPALGVTPQAGDWVQTLGHAQGIPYSWASGYVDGVRWMALPDVDPIKGWFTGATIEVRGGNSGGGLWDEEGRLLGICSFGTNDGWAWFVSRETVATFLSEHS